MEKEGVMGKLDELEQDLNTGDLNSPRDLLSAVDYLITRVRSAESALVTASASENREKAKSAAMEHFKQYVG